MLGLFLILPEIVRGFFFAHHFKTLFDIKEFKFSTIAQTFLKLIVVLLSPFIPAVLLWEQGKIAYENLKVETLNHTEYHAPKETLFV